MARGGQLLALVAASLLLGAHQLPVVAQQDQLRLAPSSHECPASAVPRGARPDFYRACTFSNLYLWRGRAYYLLDGKRPAPDLAALGVRFEVWAKNEGAAPLADFLQAVTPAALARLLRQGGADPAALAREQTVIERAVFWKARVVEPPQRGEACPVGTAGPRGKSNYGHFTAEWLPALYMTLCEQFGHCRLEDRRGLQIIDVQARQNACNWGEAYPPYFEEELACLSDRPLLHLNGSRLAAGGLARVRAGWMGLGPRCRGIPDGCYAQGSGRLPPTPQLVAGFRRLLGRCLGFPEGAAAPLQPLRVMVVDRPYAGSRHILNINSVVRALQARYSPEAVEVRLEYMEGLSVAQQAALWSRASVVMHMHGAALGNYFFLPRHAVGIQLAPLGPLFNPEHYTKLLSQDLAGQTDVEVLEYANRDPARVHLNTEDVERLALRRPDVAAFLAAGEQYAHFVRNGTCLNSWGAEAASACQSLLYYINISLDVDAAVDLTDRAIALAFQKQGRQPPKGLLAADRPQGASGSSSGSSRGGGGGQGGSSGSGGSRRDGSSRPRGIQSSSRIGMLDLAAFPSPSHMVAVVTMAMGAALLLALLQARGKRALLTTLAGRHRASP